MIVPTSAASNADEFAGELASQTKNFLATCGGRLHDVSVFSLSMAAKCVATSDGFWFLGDNIPALHVVEGVPLLELLRVHVEIPVIGLNDGVAAALGEQGCVGGAAYGTPNVLAITVGTGVGGAVVANGEPVFFDLASRSGEQPTENSENRNGPEIGHWKVDESKDAPRCGCAFDDTPGSDRGHLEAMFSGKALSRINLSEDEKMPLLHERGLRYLPRAILPLAREYGVTKVVIAGGLGAALMSEGFGRNLKTELGDIDVAPANFENASLKGAERFAQLFLVTQKVKEN